MLCSRQLLYVMFVLACTGCEAVLGLSEYRQEAEGATMRVLDTCSSQLDCQSGESPDASNISLCTPERRCVAVKSEQCEIATKPVRDAQVLVLGSLFGTSGAGGMYNGARQSAVVMAVDEINERGGVPALGGTAPRKLVLVSCDASADPDVAAQQLVKLGAIAVIGPAESDAVLNVSMKHTIAAGTLLISPTAMSSSIKDLLDGDLSWQMSPTVEQRAPLMKLALTSLEEQLALERPKELKLGIVFEDDTLGRSSLASLQQHMFAGETVSASSTRTGRVRIDRFPSESADRASLIAAYRAFAPDVIVLLGQSQLVTEWMAPLERSYEAAAELRPHYLLTEAAKTPELLALAQQISGLRGRVRGVSVTTTDRARPVFEGFQNRFETRFGEGSALVPGVGAAYDSLYAIAYALSSIEVDQAKGPRIASALHWLSGGSELVGVGTSEMSTAFRKLSAHERVATLGTMSELRWDDSGATRAGALEVFCVASGDEPPRFVGSGLRWDVAGEQVTGSLSGCGAARSSNSTPDVVKTGVPPVVPPPGQLDQVPPEAAMPSAGAESGAMRPTTAAGSSSSRAGSGGAHAGTGGASGMAGAAGGGGAAAARGRTDLSCGERRTCQLDQSEFCCVSALRPVTGPLPTDLSCRAAPPPRSGASAGEGAAGTVAVPQCALALFCASDRQCPSGQVCCADETRARCTSAAECSSQAPRRLACAAPEDCPSGTQCCIRTQQNLSAFSNTSCETRCAPAAGSGTICKTDDDCPMEGNTRLVCNQSYVLPNVRVCWPATE